MSSQIKLNELITDLPSKIYHSTVGYSSSQLKDAYKDPRLFYNKYITKTIEREESTAFDVGTYFHTAVLEPHLLDSEIAVFKGIKRGEKWDKFKIENAGKCLVSESDKAVGDTLASSVFKDEISIDLIKKCKYEVSIFTEVVVRNGTIYSGDGKKMLDAKRGWVKTLSTQNASKGNKFVIKCRADAIELNAGMILDLKSTSGNVEKHEEMQSKIVNYQYDLSAAMYLDVFTIGTGVEFKSFIWTFSSKDNPGAASYVASHPRIQIGRRKWMDAIITISECVDNKWSFPSKLRVMEPMAWELNYLKTSDSDLL